jgi:hypothetical protein
LASDPWKKTTVEVLHFFLNRRSVKIWATIVKILYFKQKIRNENPLQKDPILSGIASQWDGELGGKKTSCQNPILKMVMGSQIGLLGRKRSFQGGMGEHA